MPRHIGGGPITVGDIAEGERPIAAFERANWCDVPFEHAIRRALLLGADFRAIRRLAEDTAVRVAIMGEQGNLPRAAEPRFPDCASFT